MCFVPVALRAQEAPADPAASASPAALHSPVYATDSSAHIGVSDSAFHLQNTVPCADSKVDADPEAFSDFADLELESLLESEAIITTASKAAVSSVEAPSVVSVITRETLAARGYRSVGEALASVPGLYVVDNHVFTDVTVRGIGGGPDSWSRIIKVMVDGQPVTHYPTGGTFLGPELIPMEAIEAIEIIRGPGSALYGANAFLGVVNIVTRKAQPGAKFVVASEGGLISGNPSGGLSLSGSVASIGASKGSVFFAADLRSYDRSGLRAPETSPHYAMVRNSPTSQNDTSQPLSLYGRAQLDAGAVGQFKLSVLHQRLKSYEEWGGLAMLTHKTLRALSNTVLRADYSKQALDNRFLLKAFASINRGETLPEQRLDRAQPAFYYRRDRSNLAAAAGVETGYFVDRHSLILGVDLLDDFESGDTVYQEKRPAHADAIDEPGDRALQAHGEGQLYSNLGVYAQGVLYPLDNVGLTAGLRYDFFNLWSNTFNYRLAAVWQVIDGLHIKLLYGTSFMPPSPSQRSAAPLGLGTVRGNEDLLPQNAHIGELFAGYRFSKHVYASVNAFLSMIDNKIEFVSVGSNQTARNLTRATSWGGESSVEVAWSPFYAQANVSLQRTWLEDPELVPSWWRVLYDAEGPGGLLPPGAPWWMGNVNTGVRLPQYHMQANVSMRFASERKAAQATIQIKGEAYTLDPYVTFDVHVRSLGLRILGERETEFSLHATNLLDARYADAGAHGIDLPVLGRSVLLRLRQSF